MTLEDPALLRKAAFFLLLLLGGSASFRFPYGACGCSRVLPLASAMPRDGSLPTPFLLEASEAFVGLFKPHKVLGVNVQTSPCS